MVESRNNYDKLTERLRNDTSGALCESLTTAVNAVIVAIFESARAIRLDARWADEKAEFVLVDEAANVATTPSAPATRAAAPAQSPAPDPPKEAPWTSTRIPKTTKTIPECKNA